MAEKKRKIKTPTPVLVAQTRQQVVEFIGEIGEAERDLMRIAAEMGDEMAVVKEKYENMAEPQRQRIDALTRAVQAWCDVNRDVITENGKVKTVPFPTGEVSWRVSPPSVKVTGQIAVLESLERAGLTRYVRVKKELDKEAVLADPVAVRDIKGIKITQQEDFTVKPFEVEMSEA